MQNDDSGAIMELREYQCNAYSNENGTPLEVREDTFNVEIKESHIFNENSISHTEETKLLKECTSENQVDSDTGFHSPEKEENEIFFQNRDKFDTPVLESRPPSHMWLAICTTIFFNPLIGIIALVLASKYSCYLD